MSVCTHNVRALVRWKWCLFYAIVEIEEHVHFSVHMPVVRHYDFSLASNLMTPFAAGGRLCNAP